MKTKSFSIPLLLCILFNSATTIAQTKYNYYFGNLHAHTIYSDGAKDSKKTGVDIPAEAFKFAKHSKHLDFLGISEHNHKQAKMMLANYAKGLQQAKEATENGKFVALYGMEYGLYDSGHILVYGIDKLIGWDEGYYDLKSEKNNYPSLYTIMTNYPNAFATLAHPKTAHFNNLKTSAYSLLADKAITGVAIANGPHTSTKTNYSLKPEFDYYGYYTQLLSLGYTIGPTIDHDTHNTTFGRHTAARTVVLAKKLARDDIMDAYRSNRFYASHDWNAQVDFTINDQPLGSYIKNTDSISFKINIEDPDAADKIKKITIMYGKPGSGIKPTVFGSSQTSKLNLSHVLKLGEAYYYYALIEQIDGDKIVTSPIWAKY